ncbi:MAG: hypothetical protein AAFX99_14560 [Myxococcota bacterium]
MNTTLQHLRRAFLARVVVLFAAMAMMVTAAVAVVTPASVAVAEDTASKIELSRLVSRYDEQTARLSRLQTDRRQLEEQYRAITARVSKAKRAEGDRSVLQGIQLENLLEEGRVLADALNDLQKAIRVTEGQLEQTRRQIVVVYDDLVAQAERDLVQLPSGSRSQALARINSLNKARQSYIGQRTATPDLNLKDLSRIAETPISDPEEAEAAAAELDDANRKLQKQITGLDREIERLRRRKQTRSKARDFRDQEQFFDEQVVTRQVAQSRAGEVRLQAPTNLERSAEAGGVTAATNDAAEEAFGGDVANSPPQDNSPGNQFTDTDSLGDDGTATESDPTTAGGGGSGERNTMNSVTVGPDGSTPDVRVPNGSDPFGSTGVVVRGDLQPSELQDPDEPSGRESLDAKLKRLEREKNQLERKSKQFKERSEKLRKLADEL